MITHKDYPAAVAGIERFARTGDAGAGMALFKELRAERVAAEARMIAHNEAALAKEVALIEQEQKERRATKAREEERKRIKTLFRLLCAGGLALLLGIVGAVWSAFFAPQFNGAHLLSIFALIGGGVTAIYALGQLPLDDEGVSR